MKKPFLIGGAMALMMLWMLHDRLMGAQAILASAAIAFLATHLAIVLPLIGLTAFVPKVRRAIASHRPNLAHIGAMIGGILITAAGVHFAMHGLS